MYREAGRAAATSAARMMASVSSVTPSPFAPKSFTLTMSANRSPSVLDSVLPSAVTRRPEISCPGLPASPNPVTQ